MRELKQLNIDESIKIEKLVFKESWFDKFDTITIYFIFGWTTIIPFLAYFDPHRDKNKTGLFYYLIFFMTLFGVYVIYRKATEKKLIKILSSYDQEQNRKLVQKHLVF